jgi:hypothetical protein
MIEHRFRWIATALTAVAVGCADVAAPNTESGLRVWADASPSLLHLSDNAAVVRIRIYAANPNSRELRIRSGGPPYIAAGDPIHGQGFAEEYRLEHGDNPFTAGPTIDWGWDTVYVFPARSEQHDETILPLRTWNAGGVPPDTGTYTVRSYFNQHEGAPAQFRIVP